MFLLVATLKDILWLGATFQSILWFDLLLPFKDNLVWLGATLQCILWFGATFYLLPFTCLTCFYPPRYLMV